MVVAKETGISISEFRITGFYPRVASEDRFVWGLTAEALSNVEELQVIDSPAMMEYLVPVPLPRLRRFELGSCWLSCAHLEAFVYAHASTLRYLHLEDIWLLQAQNDEDGVHLSLASAKSVLQSLSRVRNSGILQELTINRRRAGHYEVHEVRQAREPLVLLTCCTSYASYSSAATYVRVHDAAVKIDCSLVPQVLH
jgi:hypothetical protein